MEQVVYTDRMHETTCSFLTAGGAIFTHRQTAFWVNDAECQRVLQDKD